MKLRVVELYNGIGGCHYALKAAQVDFEVVAALDINTTAYSVYKQNFPSTNAKLTNILGLTVDIFTRLLPDMVWMSPPCQPFTRQGLKLGLDDKRTDSFVHVLDLLGRLELKPSYICMENVKGFESSDARDLFVKFLKECNYDFQEFLLNSNQFGIPNSRLRYYLLAKLKSVGCFPFQTIDSVMSELSGMNIDYSNSGSTLDDYIEDLTEEQEDAYLVPDKILFQYIPVMDIVTRTSKGSCCFTKGYAHLIQGTGSILQSNTSVELSVVYNVYKDPEPTDEDKLKGLKNLRLRYFTPREVANLMGFPTELQFPEHITTRQRYKVLGNSLNVTVVTQLLKQLLSP